jgi:hypothetical protein
LSPRFQRRSQISLLYIVSTTLVVLPSSLPARTSTRRKYSFLEVTSSAGVPSIVSSSLRHLLDLGPLLCQGTSRANTALTAPQPLPLVVVLAFQCIVTLHNWILCCYIPPDFRLFYDGNGSSPHSTGLWSWCFSHDGWHSYKYYK